MNNCINLPAIKISYIQGICELASNEKMTWTFSINKSGKTILVKVESKRFGTTTANFVIIDNFVILSSWTVPKNLKDRGTNEDIAGMIPRAIQDFPSIEKVNGCWMISKSAIKEATCNYEKQLERVKRADIGFD